MNKTTISWTNYTSNPLRARNVETGKLGWYCTKVSPGCAHCYSERINLGRFGNHLEYDGKDNVKWELNFNEFVAWKSRRKPTKVFVCDMLDLFHESIDGDMIYRVFQAMAEAPQHTFQILTKRADRMRQLVPLIRSHLPDRLEHVWLGVSVENQRAADERIPLLLQTPAAVRFLSCEPLLGPVDLSDWLSDRYGCDGEAARSDCQVCSWQMNAIDWVICGGESGPGYRPMDLDWARSIRDQCIAASVPFFFKQSAGPRPGTNATLDSKEWKEFPR